MKKSIFTVVVSIVVLLLGTVLYGQEISVKKLEKDAKKQAKTYVKQGWLVAPGHNSIEIQQLRAIKLQNTFNEDYSPKYIMGSAMSNAGNYDAAKFQATELAKIQIAGIISSDVAGLVENNIGNSQLDAGQAASIVKSIGNYKSFIASKLTNIIPVIDMYMIDPKTKNTTVTVGLFYNKEEAVKMGIQAIREQMMKESEELGKELDSLLGL